MCATDHDNDRSLEKSQSHQEHLRESGPLDELKIIWVIICYHINYLFGVLTMSPDTGLGTL